MTTKIRMVLALDSPMQREAFRKLLADEPDIELVAEVEDAVDLLLTVDLTGVNVVLHGWPEESGELPGICTHILTEYPDLLLIGIPADADRAYACRQMIATTPLAAKTLHEMLAEIRRSASPVP